MTPAAAYADVHRLLRSPRCVLFGHAPVYEQRHHFAYRNSRAFHHDVQYRSWCRRCGIDGDDVRTASWAARLGRRWRELVRRVEAERGQPIDSDLPF